ncbi:hypothetical protein [Photobacterium sp. TY1-4]|nr:hypothetical protein [Photobacterium sp. TY1-4]UXH99902.1 hypothetical protein NH461_08620 [Photobacterium sp. TY1-4]
MEIERRLESLELVLPAASDPKGSYCHCVRTGNLPIIIDSIFEIAE